ncbi:MAG: hypothetical protein ABGX26_02440 [Nautiliaceae bacterium]|jgi:hypothetical protein
MDMQVNGNVININSPIATIADAHQLIEVLNSKENASHLILNIKSFSLPSSIIGELLRLADSNVKITINIYDNTLYELFEALNLTSKFDIRKR